MKRTKLLLLTALLIAPPGCVLVGDSPVDSASAASTASTASAGPDSASSTSGGSASTDASTTSATATTTDSGGVVTAAFSDTECDTDCGDTDCDTDCVEPEGWCDAFAQDCPDGYKCSAYEDAPGSAWNALKCVPIQGDDAPGEPCTALESPLSGHDSCEEGAMCWNVDEETLVGTCIPLCGGTPDEPECGEGTTCSVTNDGVLNLCMTECDPLEPDCAENESCTWMSFGAFVCVPKLEELPVGESCDFQECMTGSVCIDAGYLPTCEGFACCTPLCDTDAADPCAALPGSTCTPWFEEMPPEGLESLGVCLSPP